MNYEKTEKKDLYRDTNTGALLNRNIDALNAYKKRKQQARMVQEHDERLARIEKNLNELHEILIDVAEKLK